MTYYNFIDQPKPITEKNFTQFSDDERFVLEFYLKGKAEYKMTTEGALLKLRSNTVLAEKMRDLIVDKKSCLQKSKKYRKK